MARSANSTSRFTRRRLIRRLSRIWPALVVGIAVVTLGFAGWVVFVSSWLAVDKVTVSGEHTIPANVLIKTAGITTGTPMARVNLDRVTEQIAALPAVAHASAHRSWPHTIAITVIERRPVANVSRAGTWWVMDKGGTVFRQTPAPVAGLPLVDVASQAEADNAHEVLHEVGSVAASMPHSLSDRVRTIQARSMDSIELVLTDGRRVRWGSAAQSGRKVAVLSMLLRQPAHAYDVSAPASPTVSRG